MNKKNYILRLLTLVIYFLPFSFFYSGCEGVAFNKADAIKLQTQDSLKKASKIKEEIIDSTLIFNDSANVENSISNNINSNDIRDTTSLKYIANKLAIRIFERAMMPTEESISAIGITQIFENIFGQVCIILSIFISIILIVLERFFREKNKLIQYLLLFNLLCVIAFIIDGFLFKVELKYGVWTLLIVLILQFYLEIKRSKEIHNKIENL